MLRAVVLAAFMFALAGASAGAQEQRSEEADQTAGVSEAPRAVRDRFVVSGDECGASRYRHLLGHEYAQVYHAALLPADTIVQNRNMWRTLEYTPQQLNVVLGAEGRIVAIGCF